MGIWDVRAAIEAASLGGIALHTAALDHADGKQILSIAGWHRDGTPFALRSAPFDGDPILRGKELSRDLIRLHYGGQRMARSVSGLARLMGTLKDINSQADALADRFAAASQGLTGEMAATSQIVAGAEQAHEELRAINKLYSNGGPDGPLLGSSKE